MKLFSTEILLCMMISLSLLCSAETSLISRKEFKVNFRHYHRTDVLDRKLTSLVHQFPDLIKETKFSHLYGGHKYNLLKYYDIGLDNNQNKERIFLLGGEHARELIGVETVYSFLKDLLLNRDSPKNRKLLENFDFRVIVNANPYGRKVFESGRYCQRGNDRNVDINRNYNVFWGRKITTKEENPGKFPFSEKESSFVRKAMKSFNPKIFLTVHSGIYGLYTPYAFLKQGVDPKVERPLYRIQKKYCKECKVGPASILLKYQSSGTSLDYAFVKLKIPYSYTWEIYDDSANDMKKLASLIYKHFGRRFRRGIGQYNINMLQTASNSSGKVCFTMFNPTKKVKQHATKWVKALKSFFLNMRRVK